MSVEFDERHARPVPRYTSYPTAPHFHAGIDDETYGRWLEETSAEATLSLYLHVPFCDRLCWFCGCHTKQVNRYSPISAYLRALHAEIETVAIRLAGRGNVTAMHLGGGSPSMLSANDLAELSNHLRPRFSISRGVEFSIEIDPNDMDETRYDALASIGISRVSLGVQDFNPQVQAAINRIQTYEQTKAVVDGMRSRGVTSVNLDVLYGLPHQTVASVEATVGQALTLDPDRLAIFGYAHVPWIKTHQKMIDDAALPGLQARFEQSRAAAAAILAAGYEPIGFDHFAKPGDALAIAAREGRLHRNFQGYTTDEATALIGFGASAIGRFPRGYVQNTVPTAVYQRQVEHGGLAIARGVALSDDDRARSWVIERLLCDFSVSCEELTARYPAQACGILQEMEMSLQHDDEGFTEFDGIEFRVRPVGRPFVRSIASVFDSYLKADKTRYSVAV